MRLGWQHPVPIIAALLIIISTRFDFFYGDILMSRLRAGSQCSQ